MRKLLLSLIMLLVSSAASYAGDFTAELSTVNSFKGDKYSDGHYNGLKIDAGYQLDFGKRLYVEPQLGVSWLYHNAACILGGSGYREHVSSVGFDAGLIGGFRLGPRVAFITGPEVDVEMYRQSEVEGTEDSRTQAWWRFGFDISIWRLRLRATVNVGMNKPYSSERNDSYTIGLGWRF